MGVKIRPLFDTTNIMGVFLRPVQQRLYLGT